MNFLSHYYFERQNTDSYMIMGTVLPDLTKNAHKDWTFHPQKHEELFKDSQNLASILVGWKKHLEVDVLFHSSDFFEVHTSQLKQELLPILDGSPVRPSFLAHIGIELLLDHLLVAKNKININSFYHHLENVEDFVLDEYLKKCGANDTEHFFKFLSGFKSSRYLLSYQKLENISYALQRICMRLWAQPFKEETVLLLTEKLELYKTKLETDYLSIFDEIEAHIER
ncbi:MAG: DUF479 domain-containing protein [Pedobacter sp.]|nr:MAG: DUF479 domain-containing protein [Pedobacter sp.]